MTENKTYCQVAGCGRRAVEVVSVDLPSAWEASPRFTTLSVHAALCRQHNQDVADRVEAMVEARIEFHDLLRIITAAVEYEHGMQVQQERASAELERLELENGAVRQRLQDAEAALRVARRTVPRLAVAGGGA